MLLSSISTGGVKLIMLFIIAITISSHNTRFNTHLQFAQMPILIINMWHPNTDRNIFLDMQIRKSRISY